MEKYKVVIAYSNSGISRMEVGDCDMYRAITLMEGISLGLRIHTHDGKLDDVLAVIPEGYELQKQNDNR